MKIQVRIARSIGITIDGQRPAKSFSVGETTKGYDCHDSIGSEKGVMVGPHEIKGIYLDCDIEEFQEGTNPTIICLQTSGDPILAHVIQVIEDPNDETATLIDGDTKF